MIGTAPSSYYSNAVKHPILTIVKEDRFYLDLEFLSEFDGQEPEWGPVGKFTYKRTYARPTSETNDQTEEFWQCLERIVNGVYTVQKWHCRHHNLPWSDSKAQRSAQTMFRLMWDFKFLPGGRGLWMMGTDYVEKHGSACLNNCSFHSTKDIDISFAEPFCFLMDFSMLGVGVGSDCRGAGKVTIQQPILSDDTYVVGDSREGWVDLLFLVLEAYVGNGTLPSLIDYSQVRPHGALIKGFGGTASGPGPLREMLLRIMEILDRLVGLPITSEAIVDIFDLIGVCVVAGNTRRSAIIMFGEHKDQCFLDLKNPKINSEAMKSHRWACVTGDTLVDTTEGLLPISDLEGREDLVVRLDGSRYKALGVKLTGRKPTFLVSTVGGPTVCATANHQFMTKRGWVRLDALSLDDRLIVGAHADVAVDKLSVDYGRGYMLGSLIGDGTFTTTTTTRTPIARVMTYTKDSGHRSMMDFMESSFDVETRSDFSGFSGPHGAGDSRYFLSAKAFTDYAASFGVTRGSKTITPAIEQSPSVDLQAGVMAGLFDADGWVVRDRKSLAIEQADLDIIRRMQRILLRLGIQSRITKGKPPEIRMISGRSRQCKQMWRLTLCGYSNAARFVDTCGIQHDVKLTTWNNIDPPPTTKTKHTFAIESITSTNKIEDVYDICVPGPNAFLANGLYVHNSNNSVFADVGMDYTETAARSAKAGEPGYIWLENSRKYGRMGELAEDRRVLGTNPCGEISLETAELCVGGNTNLQLPSSVGLIKDYVGKQVKVWNGDTWSEVTPRVTGRDRELYRVTLSDGSYLDCTANHGWHIQPRTKSVFRRVETMGLSVSDKVVGFEIGSIAGQENPHAYEMGFFTGDGYIDRKAVMAVAYGGKLRLRDEGSIKGRWRKEQHPEGYADPFARLDLSDYISLDDGKRLRDKTGIPKFVFASDKASTMEFVAGYIDADGTVTNKGTAAEGYRVYGSEGQMRGIQMLLRRVGVNHSTIRLFAREGEETNYGTRSYDLWYCQISSFECGDIPTRLKKVESVGQRYKVNQAHPDGRQIDRARKQRIVSIEKLDGLHTTYCFDEPENHMAVFGNVLTYQCNLVETFPSRHASYEEYERTIKYAYLYAKTVSLIPTHNPKTNSVMLRNRRIGLSQSGIIQSFKRHGRRKHFTWCDQGYAYVTKLDRIYSEWLCVRKSIKKTTVKPSGTVSLLPGVTPGIHFEHSEFYYRTIRIAGHNPLVEEYHRAGYRVEEDVYDKSGRTSVIYFPIKAELFERGKSDVSIWEQMENAAKLQKYWSDNSVSVTVSFKPEEADDIQRCLELYENRLKTVSFLPLNDHGYEQAPYITITKEEYEAAAALIGVTSFNGIGHDGADSPRYCDGDTCIISRSEITEEQGAP